MTAYDLPADRDTVVTITEARVVTTQDEGGPRRRVSVSFEETHKVLRLGKSRARDVAAIVGTDRLAEWAGKKINLFAATVQEPGGRVLRIRYRPAPLAMAAAPTT